VLSSNERTWEGDTPDIGAVLGLRTEYLNKKILFRVFMETNGGIYFEKTGQW